MTKLVEVKMVPIKTGVILVTSFLPLGLLQENSSELVERPAHEESRDVTERKLHGT